MVLHLAAGAQTHVRIYNSRNFVWFYTYDMNEIWRVLIYNSRNFVWFYTKWIYDHNNHASTIVEFLYGFTPPTVYFDTD